jgi:hypothetical protein
VERILRESLPEFGELIVEGMEGMGMGGFQHARW